jgi:TRAP-type transport system periplasmic protein
MMRSAVMAVLVMLAVQCSQGASAEAQFKMRASVDTSSTHGRTLAVGDYLKKLQEKSGGRIETELFHSGQLFRDRDVVKALRQGAVEMAAARLSKHLQHQQAEMPRRT